MSNNFYLFDCFSSSELKQHVHWDGFLDLLSIQVFHVRHTYNYNNDDFDFWWSHNLIFATHRQPIFASYAIEVQLFCYAKKHLVFAFHIVQIITRFTNFYHLRKTIHASHIYFCLIPQKHNVQINYLWTSKCSNNKTTSYSNVSRVTLTSSKYRS